MHVHKIHQSHRAEGMVLVQMREHEIINICPSVCMEIA